MALFTVDLTLPENADLVAVADWLLLHLCAQDDDVPYVSCDSVEPNWREVGNGRGVPSRAAAGDAGAHDPETRRSEDQP